MADTRAHMILLVEDNPVDARLMQGLLEKADPQEFSLQPVDCLGAALASLAQQAFAAILLD